MNLSPWMNKKVAEPVKEVVNHSRLQQDKGLPLHTDWLDGPWICSPKNLPIRS
jgi:hypothetical protein